MSSSKYCKRSWPGSSWHARMIRATRRSRIASDLACRSCRRNGTAPRTPRPRHARSLASSAHSSRWLSRIHRCRHGSGWSQQLNHRRENLLARQPAEAHVFGDPRPNLGSASANSDRCSYFAARALALVGVVAILLAPLGVAAGGLNVPSGGGADPDVGPAGGMTSERMRLSTTASATRLPRRIKIDEASYPPAGAGSPAHRRTHSAGRAAPAWRFRGNTDLGVGIGGPCFPPNFRRPLSVPARKSEKRGRGLIASDPIPPGNPHPAGQIVLCEVNNIAWEGRMAVTVEWEIKATEFGNCNCS